MDCTPDLRFYFKPTLRKASNIFSNSALSFVKDRFSRYPTENLGLILRTCWAACLALSSEPVIQWAAVRSVKADRKSGLRSKVSFQVEIAFWYR